jgi:predicted esterase
VRASVIAMSVLREEDLASPRHVGAHDYFLLHSPDDRTCPYRMAETARDVLRRRRADVCLVPYAGGHGWHRDAADLVREGVAWLDGLRR